MVKVELSRRGAIFLFLVIFLVDQLSKQVVKFFLPTALNINSGTSWGFFPRQNVAWSFLSLLLLGVLFLWTLLAERKSWPMVMILGGGVSNLCDRLFYGGVRDFFRLGFWPAFNLADVAITAGVIFLFFSFPRSDGGAKNNPLKPRGVFRE